MSTLTLLHPGQMGAAIGASAVRAGHTVLWCPDGRSEATRQRADDAGLTPATTLAHALDASELVLSVCPPAAATAVADAVAGHRYRGLYVEANAVSPTRATDMAQRLTEAGAEFCDAAIIGPPPGGGRTARLYTAATDEHPVLDELFDAAVEVRHLGRPPGAASALKMAFASYQKTARTLAAVAHALAERHGVTDALLAEGAAMPAGLLADPDFFPQLAARAWRWAPELDDVAATLRDETLPDDLAQAAAAVLRLWEPDKDNTALSPADVLRHLTR